MEWTEETIERLRSLWQEGLSTAEIGRRMSITKNAVVGKAHRLVLSARPSPIRKVIRLGDAGPSQAARPARVPAASEAVSGSVTHLAPRPAIQAAAVDQGPDDIDRAPTNVMPLRPGQGSAARPSSAAGTLVRPSAASRDADAPRHEPSGASASRSASEPLPRRRSQSCCWPLGDPGTKQFHFCGSEPIQGKPYCVEHAQLAYVKLRDRRDTVA